MKCVNCSDHYQPLLLDKKTGELGSHLYVSAEGEYEVIKDGKVLGRCSIIFIISIILIILSIMIITVIFPT